MEVTSKTDPAYLLSILGEFTNSLSDDLDRLRRVELDSAKSLLTSISTLVIVTSFVLAFSFGARGLFVYSFGDARIDLNLPMSILSFGIGFSVAVFSLLRFRSSQFDRFDLKIKVRHKAELLQEITGMIRRERDRSMAKDADVDLAVEFRLLEAETIIKQARQRVGG